MQQLPLGESDFSNIRLENKVYVDKTLLIYRLVTENKFYFLSRPRRFGKSLLISTLKYLFEGRIDLFKGLWLAEHSNWTWQSHPVIMFDFNSIPHDTVETLSYGLNFAVDQIAQTHQVTLKSQTFSTRFQELILALHTKTGQSVVILVDEYDKPLIEHLGKGKEHLQTAFRNRDLLRQVFGVLKSITIAPVLRFVLLTGVTRFSRVSIFSELNNLYDLSMSEAFVTMLGYTQQELETYFAPRLAELALKLNFTQTELLQQLAYHYNGYRFSQAEITLYNPYSILSALTDNSLKNFWFETGTPTFLINLLKEQQVDLPTLDELEIDVMALNTFDLQNLQPEALLFQTGYLTIKNIVDNEIYTLGYPNYEVKQAFNKMLLSAWVEVRSGLISSLVSKLNRYLLTDKLPQFFETMQAIFATIPYDIQAKQTEGYYHTVFYLMMVASGSQARNSILTSQGRIDLAIFFKHKMYIFEFKCNQPAQTALEQIKQQGYALPYRQTYPQITLIGVNFSSEKRNVTEWKIEVVT